MFVPTISRVGQDVTQRFPQHVLFCSSTDFLVHGLRPHYFDYMVVQERHPAFDGMPHFHAISKEYEKVIGQAGLGPEVERLIQWLSAGKLAGNINIIEEAAQAITSRAGLQEPRSEYCVHLG